MPGAATATLLFPVAGDAIVLAASLSTPIAATFEGEVRVSTDSPEALLGGVSSEAAACRMTLSNAADAGSKGGATLDADAVLRLRALGYAE